MHLSHIIWFQYDKVFKTNLIAALIKCYFMKGAWTDLIHFLCNVNKLFIIMEFNYFERLGCNRLHTLSKPQSIFASWLHFKLWCHYSTSCHVIISFELFSLSEGAFQKSFQHDFVYPLALYAVFTYQSKVAIVCVKGTFFTHCLKSVFAN